MFQYFTLSSEVSTPIEPIFTKDFTNWSANLDAKTNNWLAANNFSAKSGSWCLIADDNGKIARVLIGLTDLKDFWIFGSLPSKLPEGIYHIEVDWEKAVLQLASLAFGLGCYKFSTYQSHPSACKVKLRLDKKCDASYLENMLTNIFWVRDLINSPAEDMNPSILAKAAVSLGLKFSATVNQIIGEDLIKKGLMGIYTVGRASPNSPRLVELRWGKKEHPKITLIGKGICFDTGGLALKPEASLLRMKKDMAGAAHALGLANLIMTAGLPINLRVLLPIAENVVGSSSFKHGDVIRTYKGITVEVTSTDAEGRLLLADALALASEESPQLLIDFATLTGAALAALGPEIPAMFSNDENLAKELLNYSAQEFDPMWQMPLYEPYKNMLDSDIADLTNSSNTPYAGAITAALFLREFIDQNLPWLHFDMTAYNFTEKPARSKHGEAQVIRTVFAYLQSRFGKSVAN